jgi:mitogen-activated protein kinase kinase
MSSDPSGVLNFSGKAVVHASGVDFTNGSSFTIGMGQFRLDEDIGKGNYGTVKKVLHKPTNVAMAMKVTSPYPLPLIRALTRQYRKFASNLTRRS